LILPHDDPLNTFPSNTLWEQIALDWLLNFNSENTRKNYRYAVNCFFASCRKHPEMVTQSDVLRYRYEMEEAGYNQATINQRLAALSSLYKYAAERALHSGARPIANPCDGVRRKPINPYGKATFLDGQARQDIKLLNVIDRDTIKGKRDYAILLIFFTTAVRVDAVANLRLRDLRHQGDAVYMQYRNKGGEIVERRLQPVVVNAILDYLDARSEVYEDSPLFVMTAHGQRGTANLNARRGQPVGMDNANQSEKPLTSRTIQRMVKHYADKAFGPGHGITPHSLRHTAAMNAIQGGASVIEVSRLLRHKNMRVTTIYIQHVSDKADDSVSEQLGLRYE
jgi:integrase/recombinase XerD